MENIIEIKNLNKSFGEIRAVDDLSFCVKQGELFAFLGVNGAGKSTTINIMCGSLSKDSGSVFIDNENLDTCTDSIKSKIGVVFQSSVLDGSLSVYDNLESRASLYGITDNAFKERLKELSTMLELDGLLKRTVSNFQGDSADELILQGRFCTSQKYLFLMSQQQDLTHRQEKYFGMLLPL